MKVKGTWPGPVTIAGPWAKATARPWNSDLPYGHLNLERGGVRFLAAATRQVMSYQVELVASPPLLDTEAARWERAHYRPFLDLHMYRRSLIGPHPPSPEGVREVKPDYRSLAEVDRISFDPLWRTDDAGLRASRGATSRGTVLVAEVKGSPIGFAIVGCSGITSYLQRIAVAPAHRGRGWGSRLVQASVSWAVRHGAVSMVLNTPPANDGAAQLYRSAGFARLPNRLRVFHYQ